MLRALLISGASAHLRHQKARGVTDPWLARSARAATLQVAMVAFAAKTARIIWAMLVQGRTLRDRASAPAAGLLRGDSRRARAHPIGRATKV